MTRENGCVANDEGETRPVVLRYRHATERFCVAESLSDFVVHRNGRHPCNYRQFCIFIGST